MGSLPPSNPKHQLMATLQDWATRLVQDTAFDEVFLFASLLYQEGAQFKPGRSDIDLILRFGEVVSDPARRVQACESALAPKHVLEERVKSMLGRASEKVPIVSAVPATSFECTNDIHKGRDHRFFSINHFQALTRQECHPMPLGSPSGELLALVYADAIPVICSAQYYRHKFLSATTDGVMDFPVHDDVEAFPKAMSRAAAQLRYFVLDLKDESQFDTLRGQDYLYDLVCEWAAKGSRYAELQRLVAARRTHGALHPPVDAGSQLLLWEILATESEFRIRARQKRAAISVSGIDSSRPHDQRHNEERQFLELAAKPSISFGGIYLKCKLIPEELWNASRTEHRYEDNREAGNQIILEWRSQSVLPNNLLTRLLAEIEERQSDIAAGRTIVSAQEAESLTQVRERLLKEGSNAYPRVAGLPSFTTNNDGQIEFRIPIGQSRFGVALIEERHLRIPTALALRSNLILNSLAVRVAYVYKKQNFSGGSEVWVEFHQRKAETATYKLAWDVGAAGYIDPHKHKTKEKDGYVSPWLACASELVEELNIPRVELPNREHYFFFGIGRNDPTGQLDLLAYCESPYVPNPRRRPRSPYVKGYARCPLTPRSIAKFVASKRKWVPIAILTLILTLESFGFVRAEIESEFARIGAELDLEP
jgi:hypothetical protein